jgi:hypothetical protein
MKTLKALREAVDLHGLVRRFAFRLLGREMMPMNIKNGDWVDHPGWRHGPVKVIDQNWSLRAVAIQLDPKGGIVVWPMRKDMRITDAPNVEVARTEGEKRS